MREDLAFSKGGCILEMQAEQLHGHLEFDK
jgi:hypothetical protein